ncbi:MAG: gas vesicle protein [Nitrosomonas sp.]|nr:gas vesicle protein [Nitrosomonas sp.]MDP1951890.1 gas vesicle protein [Nitrosomonas sp.]
MEWTTPTRQGQISICETLDRVLNKGAVVSGEIVISVADIDLLYLNVQLLLTSIETINELKQTLAPREQATELESGT